MMSRFAYWSFKDVSAGKRLRFANLLMIPLVIIVIAVEPQVTIFVLFLAYASSGPAAWLWRRRRPKRIGARAVSGLRERYLAEIGIPVWQPARRGRFRRFLADGAHAACSAVSSRTPVRPPQRAAQSRRHRARRPHAARADIADTRRELGLARGRSARLYTLRVAQTVARKPYSASAAATPICS